MAFIVTVQCKAETRNNKDTLEQKNEDNDSESEHCIQGCPKDLALGWDIFLAGFVQTKLKT